MPASLIIAWLSDATNETGFAIERKHPTTGVWEEAGRVAANVLTFTDLHLLYSKPYTYRVAAFNATGKSAYSPEVTGTTSADPLPKAPTGLTVRPL